MAQAIPLTRRSRIPSLRDLALIVMAAFLVTYHGLPRLAAFAQEGEGPQAVLGTSFTHQGRLVIGGIPAEGAYDFQFALFEVADGGVATVTIPPLLGVDVDNGFYSVQLDFGNVFDGDATWLDIQAKPSSGGAYVSLGRQQLTATPYALYARSTDWAGITNKPAGIDDGDITGVTAGAGLTGGGGSGEVTLAVAFGGDGLATAAARSDHTHLYQDWFGSDPNVAALTLRNLDADGVALSVEAGRIGLQAGVSSPGSYGVWGQSDGTNGVGVRGVGPTGVQAEGTGRGVLAFANAPGGQAVRGEAGAGNGVVGVSFATGYAATAGINNGTGCDSGSFDNLAQNCIGVYGEATGGGLAIGVVGIGKTYGLFGRSTSPFGAGVRGISSSADGVGVLGFNNHVSCDLDVFAGVDCAGVAGSTSSLNGGGVVGHGGRVGVYGEPNINVVNGIGVYGKSLANQYAGYFDGKVHVVGNITATGSITPSDSSLKRDILPLHEAGLGEVIRLRPVTFGWVPEEMDDNRMHIGLIAQEVQAVIPGVIYETGDADRLGINYSELIPVLINAMQEQQAQIEGLSGSVPAPRSGDAAERDAWDWATLAMAAVALVVATGGSLVAIRRRD